MLRSSRLLFSPFRFVSSRLPKALPFSTHNTHADKRQLKARHSAAAAAEEEEEVEEMQFKEKKEVKGKVAAVATPKVSDAAR